MTARNRIHVLMVAISASILVAVLTGNRSRVWAQPTVPPTTCTGDRDDDGVVSVSEVIYGVRIALGGASDYCRVFDVDGGGVEIVDLVSAVYDALHGCGSVRHMDLSLFREFHFQRDSALGFCPPVHAVYEATMVRDGPGIVLSLATLENGQRGVDACLPGVFLPDGCVVVRDQPARYLSITELVRVVSVFASVNVRGAPQPECRGCFIDPCVINRMEWDSLRTDDYVCSQGNRLGDAQVTTIIDLLETLSSQ